MPLGSELTPAWLYTGPFGQEPCPRSRRCSRVCAEPSRTHCGAPPGATTDSATNSCALLLPVNLRDWQVVRLLPEWAEASLHQGQCCAVVSALPCAPKGPVPFPIEAAHLVAGLLPGLVRAHIGGN